MSRLIRRNLIAKSETETDTDSEPDLAFSLANLRNIDEYFSETHNISRGAISPQSLSETRNIARGAISPHYQHLPPNIATLARKLEDQCDDALDAGEPSSKLRSRLDGILSIPWDKYCDDFPINIADGYVKINSFLHDAQMTLDRVIYGQDKVKQQMIRFLVRQIINPISTMPVIGVVGPPGVGKTTLIKKGLSQIIRRPFISASLAGVKDCVYFKGANSCYVGSKPGRLVDFMSSSGCMNPVIYFDELDKIDSSEVHDFLIALTDPAHNSAILDEFLEVEMDLSRSIIVFSFNDESLIDPVLLDRLFVLHMEGYDVAEKCSILQNYSAPEINRQMGFDDNEITIDQGAISYILQKIPPSVGMRSSIQKLEQIWDKISFQILTDEISYQNFMQYRESRKSDTSAISNAKSSRRKRKRGLEFPLTITKQVVKNVWEQ